MLKHLNSAPQRPSRVVILGAHGFLSTHLQSWCAKNAIPFRAVSSREIDLSHGDSAAQLGDLLRADDAVVMTSSVQPDKGRDYRALMTNLRMVESVVVALDRSTCAHFVYLSSDAVYDANKIPLDEDSSREPTDLYALSHIGREMLFCSELDRRKIPVCVLRLTAIYGPGDTHNAYGPNRFVRSALKEGRIVLFGRGEERRSHIHIEDAVEVIGLSLKFRSTGILNVAVRRALPFKKVAEEVVRLVDRQVDIAYAPRTVPLVHRSFVNSAIFAAYPDFRFMPLDEGLSIFIAAEREAIAVATGGNETLMVRS